MDTSDKAKLKGRMMGLYSVDYAEPQSIGMMECLFSVPELQLKATSDKHVTEWIHTVLATLPPHSGEASSQPLSPWAELALSVVRQSLEDAAAGNYDALWWLVTEGSVWLMVLDISPWIVDKWSIKLLD